MKKMKEEKKMMSTRIAKGAAAVVAAAVVAAAFVGAGVAGAGGRARGLVAWLQDAEGATVGKVRMVRTEDGAVRVSVVAAGLTPGFHGYHVHAIGTCDPEAQDPSGATVPFLSAGGHYNPDTSATHGRHAGDLPPLLVRDDGRAFLRFKTDAFRLRDLMDADGSAVIIHAGADNLSNIPATTSSGAERYHSHVDDVFGPDTATRATGDAGARFACGEVSKL